jgi:hypothetical protein
MKKKERGERIPVFQAACLCFFFLLYKALLFVGKQTHDDERDPYFILTFSLAMQEGEAVAVVVYCTNAFCSMKYSSSLIRV